MMQKTTTPEPKTSNTWERLEDFEVISKFKKALKHEV